MKLKLPSESCLLHSDRSAFHSQAFAKLVVPHVLETGTLWATGGKELRMVNDACAVLSGKVRRISPAAHQKPFWNLWYLRKVHDQHFGI
jgi:hypothetical protein